MNKVFLMSDLYRQGFSLNEISVKLNIPVSTIRRKIIKYGGGVRSRVEGVLIAAEKGRMSGMKGSKRNLSENTKKNMSYAAIARWDKEGRKKVTAKQTGYYEFTCGHFKGKGVHRVIMEKYLGRNLSKDECTHHCDGNPKNNKISNLELMLKGDHSRLHARQTQSSRKRDNKGRYI